jgi:hypothetical protein
MQSVSPDEAYHLLVVAPNGNRMDRVKLNPFEESAPLVEAFYCSGKC